MLPSFTYYKAENPQVLHILCCIFSRATHVFSRHDPFVEDIWINSSVYQGDLSCSCISPRVKRSLKYKGRRSLLLYPSAIQILLLHVNIYVFINASKFQKCIYRIEWLRNNRILNNVATKCKVIRSRYRTYWSYHIFIYVAHRFLKGV